MAKNPLTTVCREIVDDDLPSVVSLLGRGFPGRSTDGWTTALRRLAERRVPADCPRFGYLVERGGSAVGVLLTIYSVGLAEDRRGESGYRCSVSSWYVDPSFRPAAAMLASRALSRTDVTYLNATPAPETLPLLDAQGYRPWSRGRLLVPAWMAKCAEPRQRAWLMAPDDDGDFPESEARLLRDHLAWGSIGYRVETAAGAAPFIFQVRRGRGGIRHALLVWCRSLDHLVAAARPLGMALLSRGVPFMLLQANGPIAGLAGRFKASPTFCKGPGEPRPFDLSYTEYPIFGL